MKSWGVLLLFVVLWFGLEAGYKIGQNSIQAKLTDTYQQMKADVRSRDYYRSLCH